MFPGVIVRGLLTTFELFTVSLLGFPFFTGLFSFVPRSLERFIRWRQQPYPHRYESISRFSSPETRYP